METRNINDFYDKASVKRDLRINITALLIITLAAYIMLPTILFGFTALCSVAGMMFLYTDPYIETGSKSYKAALASYKEWARAQEHSVLVSMREQPEKFNLNKRDTDVIKEELQNRYYRYIDEKIISETE